jgi:nucleotide sugar dehydrogenase
VKVGMIGLGKLGKPVAVAIAARGHSVMGYDVIPELMNKNFTAIEAGPNKEPNGFQEMLQKSDIQFGSMQEVVDHSEIIFLSIQTPHDPMYEGVTRVPDTVANFDYSYLVDCVKKLNACKIDWPIVVSIISTVLPLTIRRHVLPEITNPNIKVVYNPFFIAMGTVIWDFYNPEFVLIGKYDDWACSKLKELYGTIHNKPFAEMSIESAELTKVSYNTFITMKIDYVNYLMEICDQIPNADVDDVTDALKMATDRLISTKYLTAGMGDGGNCMPSDQIIYTENGPKQIKDIQIGERVLSENGMLEKVVSIYKRPYSGKLVKIKVKGLPPALFTLDHNLFVSKDLRIKYNTISKGEKVIKYTNTKIKLPEKTSEMLEIPAKDVTKDMYALFPVPQQHYATSNMSKNYAELGGYYLSEGYITFFDKPKKPRIAFSMGKDEQWDLARIEELLKNLDKETKPVRCIKKNSGGEDVRCTSLLGWDFLRDFGKLAATKFIPPQVVFGDLMTCKELLKSMWRGDGSSHSEGFSYSTISSNLAYSIHLILKRLGIPSTINQHKAHVGKDGTEHRVSFDVEVSNAAYIEKIAQITGKVIKHKMQIKRYTNSIFEKDGYYYHHISNIEQVDYTGEVYNLNIANSHKFVTNVGLVSNCHPRDNIAMSWLAHELNIGYDFCGNLMIIREEQTEFLVERIDYIRRFYGLPIQILGKSFKANIGLTGGSPAILLSNLLLEHNIPHCTYDPVVDSQWDMTWQMPHVFFIATQHEIWKTIKFPTGSVIIDPFRYYKDCVPADCTYIPIGVGQ